MIQIDPSCKRYRGVTGTAWMIIICALIIVGIGLGKPMLDSLRESGIRQKTVDILRQADAIAAEYKAITKGAVVYHVITDEADMDSVELFVEKTSGHPKLKRFYEVFEQDKDGSGGDSDRYHYGDFDGDGKNEIRDSWKNAIVYAAFVKHDDEYTKDDFLPEHPSPYFASAGPDGRFGVVKSRDEMESEDAWNAYLTGDDYKATLDNVYSFKTK